MCDIRSFTLVYVSSRNISVTWARPNNLHPGHKWPRTNFLPGQVNNTVNNTQSCWRTRSADPIKAARVLVKVWQVLQVLQVEALGSLRSLCSNHTICPVSVAVKDLFCDYRVHKSIIVWFGVRGCLLCLRSVPLQKHILQCVCESTNVEFSVLFYQYKFTQRDIFQLAFREERATARWLSTKNWGADTTEVKQYDQWDNSSEKWQPKPSFFKCMVLIIFWATKRFLSLQELCCGFPSCILFQVINYCI